MASSPYGLWPSPLKPRHLATTVRLGDVQCAEPYLVWHESFAGRGTLYCADLRSADAPVELTPPELSVRARVGYGGGDFGVGGAYVYFVEAGDGRIYRQPITGGPARPITPAFGSAAAPTPSPDGRWVVYIHSDGKTDCVAIVAADGNQWPQQLICGHDFYMQPAWHPTGAQLAVIAWNHPQMPWDGTLLLMASLDPNGASPTVTTLTTLAGDADTAIFQPAFAPDGSSLAYISDASGWGQVQIHTLRSGATRALTSAQIEHSEPAWGQGMRTIAWGADSRTIYALPNAGGVRRVIALPVADGKPQEVSAEVPYSWYGQITTGGAGTLAMIASAPGIPAQVIALRSTQTRVLRRSANPPGSGLSIPRAVQWSAADGSVIHGMLYPPPGAAPVASSPPPAIIRIHGGPTGQATTEYNAQAQYFATRGYVVLDLNFRGSTGYGRAYLRALDGAWGKADLEDILSAGEYLGTAGEADPQRLVIMGGSSGGYAVLQALCHAPGRFRAGICLYGVSDLFGLAAETHKFEAHYTDTLVGALPEAAALYRERSPAFHADRIVDPLALFHGSDDQVVPANQADAIVASLRRRGIPHHYTLFAGEGHGFRRPETIETLYRIIDTFLREHVLFA
jgi:dipeptidyl aminopeptidase/acylaminoacyl peptidase